MARAKECGSYRLSGVRYRVFECSACGAKFELAEDETMPAECTDCGAAFEEGEHA